jgi:hypothetical protein
MKLTRDTRYRRSDYEYDHGATASVAGSTTHLKPAGCDGPSLDFTNDLFAMFAAP